MLRFDVEDLVKRVQKLIADVENGIAEDTQKYEEGHISFNLWKNYVDKNIAYLEGIYYMLHTLTAATLYGDTRIDRLMDEISSKVNRLHEKIFTEMLNCLRA